MWNVTQTKYHGVQVTPDNDTHPHHLDRLCLCVPTKTFVTDDIDPDDGYWLVLHNAWDGREARERFEAGNIFLDGPADTLSLWSEGGMV